MTEVLRRHSPGNAKSLLLRAHLEGLKTLLSTLEADLMLCAGRRCLRGAVAIAMSCALLACLCDGASVLSQVASAVHAVVEVANMFADMRGCPRRLADLPKSARLRRHCWYVCA